MGYTLKTQLDAFRIFVRGAHSVIWAGTAYLLTVGVFTVIFYYCWKYVLGEGFNQIFELVPEHLRPGVAIGVTLFFFVSMMIWLASMIWIHVEQVFWSVKARQRVFGKIIPAVSASVYSAAALAGIMFVGWGVNEGLFSRVFPDGAPGPVHVALIVFLVAFFSPLLARLWYLPAVTSLETKGVSTPWQMIQEATKGKSAALAVSVLIQAALLLPAFLIFKLTVWRELSPLVDLFTSGHYPDIASLSAAVGANFKMEIILSYLLFAIAVGPFLSLAATLQVATVRSFIAGSSSQVNIVVKTGSGDHRSIDTDMGDSHQLGIYERIEGAADPFEELTASEFAEPEGVSLLDDFDLEK